MSITHEGNYEFHSKNMFRNASSNNCNEFPKIDQRNIISNYYPQPNEVGIKTVSQDGKFEFILHENQLEFKTHLSSAGIDYTCNVFNLDTDNDGIANIFDTDDDNDGIPDIDDYITTNNNGNQANEDRDGDGIRNDCDFEDSEFLTKTVISGLVKIETTME